MNTFSLRLRLCLTLVALVVVAIAGEFVQGATPCSDDPVGIKFFKGSWKEVLNEAKSQHKPVFVDIYTTWCGPCKLMAKQAFPDPKVGEKFNTNFISYQIDAEKGEGLGVAKKYAVAAYPTSLYVSADGDLIHRAIGYGGIKGMLEEADKAIEAAKDPNPLSAMEKQYESGKRDPDFLAAYLQKRAAIEMPNDEALEAYLKTVPEAEWGSDKNIMLIAGNATKYQPKVQELLLAKLIQVKQATDEPTMKLRNKLGEGIYKLSQDHFKQAVAAKDESMLADVVKSNEAYMAGVRGQALSPDQASELANDYQMRFYQQTKNKDKYRGLATVQALKLMKLTEADISKLNEVAYQRFEEETRSLPDSIKQTSNFKAYAANMKKAEPQQTAMKLNNLAWSYYQNMDDKKDLNQALTWSAKSLEYSRVGMYLDTYAHLLSKLGRKQDAVKIQEEAIAKEKANGGDTADYEKELAIMKKK